MSLARSAARIDVDVGADVSAYVDVGDDEALAAGMERLTVVLLVTK